MAWLVFKKMCPKCFGRRIRRVERRAWMRYLPKSKYYRCNNCRTGVLVLFDKMACKWN